MKLPCSVDHRADSSQPVRSLSGMPSHKRLVVADTDTTNDAPILSNGSPHSASSEDGPKRRGHHAIEGLARLTGHFFHWRVLHRDAGRQARGYDGLLCHVTASFAGIHQRPAGLRQFQRQEHANNACPRAAVDELARLKPPPIVQHEPGRMAAQRREGTNAL